MSNQALGTIRTARCAASSSVGKCSPDVHSDCSRRTIVRVLHTKSLDLMKIMLLLGLMLLAGACGEWEGGTKGTGSYSEERPAHQWLEVQPDLLATDCGSCSIEFVEIARFGSISGDDAFDPFAVLHVHDDSLLLVAGDHLPGSIEVFNLRTRNRLRSIGRQGEGPGEFRRVVQMRSGRGGAILVRDVTNSRVTVVRPDGTVQGFFQVPPGVRDFVYLDSGSIMVAGALRTRESVGYATHLVRSDGTVHSFGDQYSAGLGYNYAPFRTFARARDAEAVWVAHRITFRVERWSYDGHLLSAHELSRDWFDNKNKQYASVATHPPLTQVAGIEERSGHLWVTIHLAAPTWRPSEQILETPEGSALIAPESTHDLLFDTIIEVLHPETGHLVVSGRSKRKLTPIGAGHYFSYEEHSQGYPIYTVWRALVVRSGEA